MEYKEYLKQKARMVEFSENGCGIRCYDCPLSEYSNGHNCTCVVFEMLYPNESVDNVENWAKEHLVVTNAMKYEEVLE